MTQLRLSLTLLAQTWVKTHSGAPCMLKYIIVFLIGLLLTLNGALTLGAILLNLDTIIDAAREDPTILPYLFGRLTPLLLGGLLLWWSTNKIRAELAEREEEYF